MGSSRTRDWTRFSYIGKWILYHWATKEAQTSLRHWLYCLEILHLWTEFTQVFFLPLFARNKQCLSCVNEKAYSSVWKQWDPGSHRHAVSVFSELHLLRPHSVTGRPSMPQEERLSGYWVRQTSSQWDLCINTLFRIPNSQKMKKTHFLPLRSLQGRALPSTNYMKTAKKLNWHINSMLDE